LGGEFSVPNGSGPMINRQIAESQVVNPSGMNEVGDALLESETFSDDGFKGIAGSCMLDLTVRDPSFFASLVLGQKLGYGDVIGWMRMRNRGRWNVGFCDGHVAALRAEDFFDWRRDDVLAHWNNDNQPHREWLGAP